MAPHPKLMIGAGIAFAGLGLIGAGAGATFTAQVSATTQITTGGVEFSLNDKAGSNVNLSVEGKNLDPHFKPISRDLRLKNIGTLDMASTYLSLTATGCNGVALASSLHVSLTDVTNNKMVYEGALCSFASSIDGPGFITPRRHTGVGGQLPHLLRSGQTRNYRLVIHRPDDAVGLPTAAQSSSTSVNLVFSGFDY